MTPKLLALDFDGVLTSNDVWTDALGNEWVRSTRADGLGIQRLRALGVPVVVISAEPSPVVGARCRKLGIPYHYGVTDKLACLRLVCRAYNVTLAEAAYLGNDLPDLPCLDAVGHPYIVRDAHPSVRRWRFKRLRSNGGHGAVRELCERLADEKAGRRTWLDWLGLLGWQ